MKKEIPGFVYVLSNKSMPGLVKVGQTTQDPLRRARQLHSSGVPSAFDIEYILYTDEPRNTEKEFHESWSNVKTPTREFFEMDVADAIISLFRMSGLDMEARHADEAIDPGDHLRYANMAGVHPLSLVQLLDEIQEEEWQELATRRKRRMDARKSAETMGRMVL